MDDASEGTYVVPTPFGELYVHVTETQGQTLLLTLLYPKGMRMEAANLGKSRQSVNLTFGEYDPSFSH